MTLDIEHEVIKYLEELVKAQGLAGDLKEVSDVALNKLRDLGFDEVWRDEFGNTIGKRVGYKPGRKVVFDAHMDTVEVGDLKAWKYQPFGAEIENNKIWGRGTADDKGSLAAFTIAIAALPKESFTGELYAVGTVGEELLEGAALETVLEAIEPDVVVIGEPTDCRLGIGHKGRCRVIFTAEGKSCHSSSPEVGENAIEKGVEILKRVRQIPLIEDALLGKSVMEPIQITSSPMPCISTIPYECQIIFDRRMVRGETQESVLEIHKKALEGLEGWSIDYDELSFDCYTGENITRKDFHPAWALEDDSNWVLLATDGLKKEGLYRDTYGTPYCTNGSTSAGERGIPTIVYGPGSVLVAHVTDEYLELPELFHSVKGFMAIAKALTKSE